MIFTPEEIWGTISVMPISKSAKKAQRSAEAKASLNRYRKALIKDALKGVNKDTVSKAVSMIDKGAKWGLFHPNKAARMKSNLSKLGLEPSKSTKKADKPATAKKADPKKPAKKAAPKAKK